MNVHNRNGEVGLLGFFWQVPATSCFVFPMLTFLHSHDSPIVAFVCQHLPKLSPLSTLHTPFGHSITPINNVWKSFFCIWSLLYFAVLATHHKLPEQHHCFRILVNISSISNKKGGLKNSPPAEELFHISAKIFSFKLYNLDYNTLDYIKRGQMMAFINIPLAVQTN